MLTTAKTSQHPNKKKALNEELDRSFARTHVAHDKAIITVY